MGPFVRSRAALLVLPALLTGCDSNQVRVCEDQLKAKLKSPASYKRISVETVQITVNKPPYDDVTITYDATNSFNALLRDTETCTFRPGTTEQIDPFADLRMDMNAVTDMNVADNLDATANLDMNATEMNADDAINATDDASTDNYDVNNEAGE